MVSEEILKVFYHYKSMETLDPRWGQFVSLGLERVD